MPDSRKMGHDRIDLFPMQKKQPNSGLNDVGCYQCLEIFI